MDKYLELIGGSSRRLPCDDSKPDPERDAAIDELVRKYPEHAKRLENWCKFLESPVQHWEEQPETAGRGLTMDDLINVTVGKKNLDDILREKDGKE